MQSDQALSLPQLAAETALLEICAWTPRRPRLQKYERGFGMYWVLMIVAVSLMFVVAVIKMAFDHHEKIERIKRGIPPTGARVYYINER
jgi:hypothetical protein